MTDMQTGPRVDCGAGKGHSRSLPRGMFQDKKGKSYPCVEEDMVSTCRHSGKADRSSRECGYIQACVCTCKRRHRQNGVELALIAIPVTTV